MTRVSLAVLTDWAKHASHWTCRACGAKLFSPPAIGSKTPKPCPACGKKNWVKAAGPRSTLQAINDQRRVAITRGKGG